MKTINTYYNDFNGLSEFVRNNQKILGYYDNSAVLIQIFNGQCDQNFLKKLLAELTELMPQALILGTTTSGEIMDGKVSGLKTVLSFSIFQQTMIRTGFFPKGHLNDFELGQKIGLALGSSKARLLILFSTGGTVKSKSVLKGLESLYPGLPVAGGIAGTNASGCFVSCQDQITNCGVVGVVLEGDKLQVNCYSNLGWQPIGKEMSITKVDGLRVCTIDNIPAYQVYRKYLGLDTHNFTNAMEYPLLVKRHGSIIARTPNFYYDDDSITFEEEFVTGEKVRFSFGDIELISEAVDNLCQEIRQYPAESIFVYSCECRRGFLQELSKIETEPLQEIANTSGFFTYGEFYTNNKINQVLNATMTVAVLTETGKKIPDYRTKAAKENTGESFHFSKDKLVARRIGVLKALTHLINTVTAELVTANEQLQYIGLHDSLSGLYNRAFFEQEMKRLETCDCPVGIVICDIDGLKAMNDTLGHSFGDKMICIAAKAISESCQKEAIVARIGGDEFAILITNPSLAMLRNIRKKIMTQAAKYRRSQPEFCLFLSVGFALSENGGGKNLGDIFKIADAQMYNYKMKNKHHRCLPAIHEDC
jgi:diguanylate cyclase (GGDEF)-like protein